MVINNPRNFLNKTPLKLALVFTFLDLLCVVLLQAFAWSKYLEKVIEFDKWSKIYSPILVGWNAIHSPIRNIIEPMLFPIITTHPLSITLSDMVIYYGVCILQSTVIGLVIGWLIQKIDGVWKNDSE